MVIKTTNNNESIIKQLTELLNQALSTTVTQTLQENEPMIKLKDYYPISDFFEEKTNSLQVLFKFINDWTHNSYYDDHVSDYTIVMSSSNRFVIKDYWVNRSLNYCLDKKTVLAYQDTYGSNGFVIDYLKQKNNTSINQDHPLNNDSTVNSLLNHYKTFNGTAEQAVLAIIKPLLINGFIERIINELDVTSEFIDVLNNYNDNEYHLNRFIKSLEKGMANHNDDPLDLWVVWRVWDEQFLKDRVVPLLKQQELSESQLKSLRSKLYCSDDELLIIKNYYDYCLVYNYALDYYFPQLENTLFLYNKEEFEHTVGIILFALNKSAQFTLEETKEQVLKTKNALLYRCAKQNLGDWVDCLR